MDFFPSFLGERPSCSLGPVPIFPAYWLCNPAAPSSVWALVLGWPCQPGTVPGVCSAGCHRKISGRPGWGALWEIPCACLVLLLTCLSSFCSTTGHATPQQPSWVPSGSDILLDTLKTSPGLSLQKCQLTELLNQGRTLGTSPSPPGPWLGRGQAEIDSLASDCSSRDRRGWGWADHPNPLWTQAPCRKEERLREACHSRLPDWLPALLTVASWYGQQ